jgi:hypothetical protein
MISKIHGLQVVQPINFAICEHVGVSIVTNGMEGQHNASCLPRFTKVIDTLIDKIKENKLKLLTESRTIL